MSQFFPSGIQYREFTSRLLDHEPPPIGTKPKDQSLLLLIINVITISIA